MLDRIIGWIDGFSAAARIMPGEKSTEITLELLIAGLSFLAAFATAVAAFKANSAAKSASEATLAQVEIAKAANQLSADNAASIRRQEILRITHENMTALLVVREKITRECREIITTIQFRTPLGGPANTFEVERLMKSLRAEAVTIYNGNKLVRERMFTNETGTPLEWDALIAKALDWAQDVAHFMDKVDSELADIRKKRTGLHSY